MKNLSFIKIKYVSAGQGSTLEAVAYTTSDIRINDNNNSWLSTVLHEILHVAQQITGTPQLTQLQAR